MKREFNLKGKSYVALADKKLCTLSKLLKDLLPARMIEDDVSGGEESGSQEGRGVLSMSFKATQKSGDKQH